jgi:flagellin-like hook-associated protein FlgL
MSTRVLRLLLVAVVGIAVAFSITCGDDDDTPDVSDAGTTVGRTASETEFCTDLAELETAVSEVRNLNVSSSVDEAKDATDDVEEALGDVKESASDVHESRVTAVETAFEDLDGAIEDIEGDETLGSVATTIRNAIDNVSVSYSNLDSQADCA